MTTPYEPSKELARLIQIAVDGQLTVSEHDRLEELLSDDSAARVFFSDFLRLHGLLNYQAIALSPTWDSREPSLDAAAAAAAERMAMSAEVRPNSDFAERLQRLAPWALAATLLLAIALPGRQLFYGDELAVTADATLQASDPGAELDDENAARPLSRPPAPVATLAKQADAVWRDGQLSVGQPFHEGETLHLDEGQAHISVGFGAEISATGPCSMTFTANDRVRLDRGTVLVDVAEWAKGFTVITDAMDVVDLGTTFSVTAGVGSATEASVLSGMVRALPRKTPAGDRRSILLSEGEGLAIDGHGNRRSFTRSNQSERVFSDSDGPSPYRPVTLHNTGIGLAEGDEDPHWRIIAGPAASFAGPCFARVCAPYERYLDNEPDVSQWVSIPGWESALPNSVYTFATNFDLAGYDLATTRLFGRFLADNGIQAVRVNGQSVRVESWTDNLRGQRFDGQQFRFVSVTDGLIDGRNTIEVDVFNGTTRKSLTGRPNNIPNHMALRVEWYAFGRDSDLVSVREEDGQPTRQSPTVSPDGARGDSDSTSLRNSHRRPGGGRVARRPSDHHAYVVPR